MSKTRKKRTRKPESKCKPSHPDETVMDDGDSVYPGYWYVVDGEPVMSDIEGTVFALKQDLRWHRKMQAVQVRRCNCISRELPMLGFDW